MSPDEEWNAGICDQCDADTWVIEVRTGRILCLDCFSVSADLPAPKTEVEAA